MYSITVYLFVTATVVPGLDFYMRILVFVTLTLC